MPNTDNILRDKKFNQELLERGYVVTSFLQKDEIQDLLKFYNEFPPKIKDAFHTTHFSNDQAYKKNVHSTIVSKTSRAIKNVFSENYRAVFSNFMIKEGGGNNSMPLHADWTYVDETVAKSFSIWIPLIDTNEENGCLGIIPFSQHLSNTIRGPRILQWEYPTNEKLISAMGKLLPLKAGEAVIYNHRVLHYSPPNNVAAIRHALNISIIPCNEPLVHYAIPEGEKEIIKFEIKADDFFIAYDNFQMPDSGEIAEKISTEHVPIFDALVNEFISNYSRNPRSFFQKILQKICV